MDAFEDDGGVDMHEDMWDSVEVDSEFEDLLDEDVYGDLDVDLETIDEKQNIEAFEHEPVPDSPSSQSRFNRMHHFGASQSTTNELHDTFHAPIAQVAKQTPNVEEYEDEDDEAEANYATQVERYTQYHQTHDHREVESDSDIDETDDEEDEATLARRARTRRPKKAPSSSNIGSSRHSRQHISPNTTRARSRKTVKREMTDDDESDYDDESYGPRSGNRANRRATRGASNATVSAAAQDIQELSLKLAREYATSIDAKKKELQEIERRIEQTRNLWDRLQNIWVNKVWNETLLAPRVQAAEAFRNAKRAGRPLKHERLSTARQIKQESEEMETIMRKLDSGAASAAARAISADRANGDTSASGVPPPKKKKKLESVSRPLYCLTPNRGFVKVVCQDCGRELFGNHLGFLNHCRMVHYVKFASWDDAVELCGTPVDESEVPADDPSRTENSSSMGFSISQQKSEAAKSYQMQRTTNMRVGATPMSPGAASNFQGGITIDHTKPQGTQGAVKIATPNVHVLPEVASASTNNVTTEVSSAGLETSRFYIKKQVIIGNSSKRLTKEDIANEDDAYKLLYWPTNMAAAAVSRSSASAQSNTTDTSSTFAVPTHRWLLSIRSIGDDKLTNYVSKVRFYLHPAFSPRNIVDVINPPFQILRETNQEWPVRLQIFFKDPRNPPMSFTHYIVFQQGALEAVGEEYYADIEIDREYISGMILDENVSMVSHIGSPSARAHHSREQQASRYHQYLESNPAVKAEGAQNWVPPAATHPADHSRSHHPAEVTAPFRDNHIVAFASGHAGDGPSVPYDTLVEFVRHAATTMFPLISEDTNMTMPYSVAKSSAEWTSWSHGKRKSSEWQRALRISHLLIERFQVRRTTREILDLCRHLNLTPIPEDAVPHLNADGNELLIPGDPSSPCVPPLSLYSRLYALPLLRAKHERLEMADHTQLIGYIRFCRFCGSVHSPLDKIDDLEITCGEKKLLVLQESHSTFRELLERSIKQVKLANIEPPPSRPSKSLASTSSQNPANGSVNDHSTASSAMNVDSKPAMDVSLRASSSSTTPHKTPNKRASGSSTSSSTKQSRPNADVRLSSSTDASGTPMKGASSEAISAAVAQANAMTIPGEKEITGKSTTPARRGRPAKASKLVGSLLASPVAASTIVTTTPGTLEAPSSATVVYLNTPPPMPELTLIDGITGLVSDTIPAVPEVAAANSSPIISTDPKTGEIKWDMHVLSTMESTLFIDFLKHLAPEQIAQLPTLPPDRLNLLIEYLNGSSESTSDPTKSDSTVAPERSDESSSSPVNSSTSAPPASNQVETSLGVQGSSLEQEHAAESRHSTSENAMDVDGPATSNTNTSTTNDEVVATSPTTSANLATSSSSSSTTAAMDTSATPGGASSAETSAAPPSAWTPAQEAVLLQYYSKHPDALASHEPLPPEILEALYMAGMNESGAGGAQPSGDASAAATTTTATTPGINSAASAPSSAMVANTPSATPSRKKKRTTSTSTPAATSSSHAATPSISQDLIHSESSSSNAVSTPSSKIKADPASPFPSSFTSSGITVAPESAAEALSHPVFGSLDFKRAERPTAAEVPPLHEQLALLELDHPTTNHADMLLLKLVTSFARRLLFGAAVAHATEKAAEPVHESKYKVMVPLHAATAIVNNPLSFDFLMDEGLARYTSLEMIQANALAEDPAAADIMEQLDHRLKLHRQMAASDASHAEAQAQTSENASTSQSAPINAQKDESNQPQEVQKAVQKDETSTNDALHTTTASESNSMQVDEPKGSSTTEPEAQKDESSAKMEES